MVLFHFLRNRAYRLGKAMLGSAFYGNLRFLRQNQFASREVSLAWQQKALANLLEGAYQTVPYYKQQFDRVGLIDASGQAKLSRLTALPPLTREDIRQNEDRLLSLAAPFCRRIVKLPTGGTTGNPVAPYADLRYWDWCLAHTWLCYESMGLLLGMPYLYFWAAPQDFGRQYDSLKGRFWLSGIQGRYGMNCRLLSEERMAGFLQEINRLPHQYMVACVNELHELAWFSQENRLPVKPSLKGILVTTAELTESMRETLQAVFHCPVYSRYGCREAGDVAFECEFQRGHHINPLYSLVEVVDERGHPLPPGEEGRVLVTNLHNHVMPLIRYEVQDLAVMAKPGSCRCGRHWDTLAQITGRLHERLELPDGATFGKVFLHYAMEHLQALRGYQLHQTAPDTVEVHLLSSQPDYLMCYPAEIQEAHDRLVRVTGNQLKVSFRQVEALEKAPSGKQLVILNKFRPDEADHAAQPLLPLL